MSRSLNVTQVDGWKCSPSPDTTVEELARAMFNFGLELLVDAELNVALVQAPIGAGNPPTIEQLAESMFGLGSDATLIDETGAFPKLEVSADPELGNDELTVSADVDPERA